MLKVKTSQEAEIILKECFSAQCECELIALHEALGRALFADIVSREYVPDFHRSTVDGYAVSSRDTFGCSDSTPALLHLAGEVRMGEPADVPVKPGSCVYVPTGGQIPDGADAVIMLEYVENFGDGTIAIQKPAAPGTHMIFRGDDVDAGKIVYRRGHRLLPKDIGALAALGYGQVSVFRRPKVAILSTGDELVPPDTEKLSLGQIRDVNGPMLAAAVLASGGQPINMGIVYDESQALKERVSGVLNEADILLISGGSSVGAKDEVSLVLSELGGLLFHGLAMKPGKPTIAADIGGKPVFGLPGNPVAAYFIYTLFVRPLQLRMTDSKGEKIKVTANCAAAIPSNHGREECVPVSLDGDKAIPIIVKSGLITTLSGADGYIRIPRDTEGIAQGEAVEVYLFTEVI